MVKTAVSWDWYSGVIKKMHLPTALEKSRCSANLPLTAVSWDWYRGVIKEMHLPTALEKSVCHIDRDAQGEK